MKTLTVIPILDWELGKQCIDSIWKDDSAFSEDVEEVLIVNNEKDGSNRYIHPSFRWHRDSNGHNLGVAGSWNIGAKEVVKRKLDYLIIMSQSILFGPMKETTWLRQMKTFEGYDVIESTGHSWHLIAIHRRVFEDIGYFDENFYPGYFEQIDFHRRMQLVGYGNKGDGHWTNVWVNAISQTVGHHSDLVLADPLLHYYNEKWGGDKHDETFNLPFGDKPISYFPNFTIPELAEKYQLKEWW